MISLAGGPRWQALPALPVAIVLALLGGLLHVGALTAHAPAVGRTPDVSSSYSYDDGQEPSAWTHVALAEMRSARSSPSRSTAAAAAQGRAPSAAGIAAKSGDEFVDLASASRRSHILDGEVRPNGSLGGGHRPGTGFPNAGRRTCIVGEPRRDRPAASSEFPAGWSDDKIMHAISDVATDPSLIWRAGNKPGDFFVNGTRGGIDIEVLIRNNQIWTGYTTNVIRNAP